MTSHFCMVTRIAAGALLTVTALALGETTIAQPDDDPPSSITPSAPLASPIASQAAALLPSCHTNQLMIRPVSGDAGVGNRAIVYAFTNASPLACTLSGYPELQLLDADGQLLQGIQIIPSQSTYFHHASVQEVTLAPGAEASFQIAFSALPDGQVCTQADRIRITPPQARRALTLTEQVTPCGQPEPWIRITPVEAGITQP
jgi:hypothetical protein